MLHINFETFGVPTKNIMEAAPVSGIMRVLLEAIFIDQCICHYLRLFWNTFQSQVIVKFVVSMRIFLFWDLDIYDVAR